MSWEHACVKAGSIKSRGTRNQIANIYWIIGKNKRIPEKHLPLLYWLCQSLCVDHNKLWTILQEMEIPDHLSCLLRNLYAGQEATVRTGHGTMDWFQIGKTVRQGCILSPCLVNTCSVRHLKWRTGWNTGFKHKLPEIKISGRNVSNLIICR